MLAPSWPSPESARPNRISARVRRRVAIAERRSLRRAVQFASGLIAALLLADLGVNLVVETPGVLTLVPFSVGASAVCGAVALAATRSLFRLEPLALVMILAVLAVALLGLVLTPTDALLGASQIATLLVGAGLFLPWSLRWHVGALVAATAVASGFVLSPLAESMLTAERTSIVIGTGMAAVASAIGHALFQVRFRRLLEQQFELRDLSRYAQRQEAHVSELNRELNRVARRDALTGVGNRLALDEALGRLLDRGTRLRPARFAIVLLDIDHFKEYNDLHGHLAGDAALGRLGELLRRATRSDDLAFRYGGEEFLLLLPDVDLPSSLAVAERVRVAAESDDGGGLPPFTVSGGVALCDPADGRDPEPLLRRADTALYLAKRAGRNRIAADELSVAMQRQEFATAG